MSQTVFDINKIKKLIPHRYPFLMIDRVIDYQRGPNSDNREGQTAVAIKNVTVNEEFFNGHFPRQPIMPGVLIVEAMAQAGGMACYKEDDSPMNLIIANIKNAKFRKPVVPGDQLVLKGRVLRDRGKMIQIACVAEVDDKVVAECEILAHVEN